MAHTLRFGDEVTLWLGERLPSFVQSEGFVDIRCLLKPSPPPSPHPPSFRGAVFRLRPVASALGALDSRPAAVGGGPAGADGGETRHAAADGEPVRYGEPLALQHARSGRFLAVTARTGSVLEPEHLLVELLAPDGAADAPSTAFVLAPRGGAGRRRARGRAGGGGRAGRAALGRRRPRSAPARRAARRAS